MPASIAPAGTVRRSRRGAIAVVIKSVIPCAACVGPGRRRASCPHRVPRIGADRVVPAPYPRADDRRRSSRTCGAQSMTAPLREVLVKAPGPAFGRPSTIPALGFLRPVDLDRARREHDGLVDDARRASGSHGPRPRRGDRRPRPRLRVRPAPRRRRRRDPAPARASRTAPASPTSSRRGRGGRGIPTLGRIEAPGTLEGGDTFWLRPDLLCIGRTLRTNDAGARQLAAIVGGDARIFDVPYWKGPAELVHLLSVISPVADDVAVVFLPLLPAGPVRAARGPRHPPGRGARGGVPDARLQRPRGPARASWSWPRATT